MRAIPEQPQRLVLAYQPGGFRLVGGLQRIARELIEHLRQHRPELALATLTRDREGCLAGTRPCRRLRSGDRLVIVGCDSGWAYGLALIARLRRLPVCWLPSFHDPCSAIHRRRARLAQAALRAMQGLGVVVYAQTPHEQRLLQGDWPAQCRLSGHALPACIRQQLNGARGPDAELERPIDLLFLGRPTPQKGWPQFMDLAQATTLRCEAIVPTPPPPQDSSPGHAGITLHLNPCDSDVTMLLRRSKIVFIPSNYESFGIGQLEALAAGCVVPILGHWPLWDACTVLQWRQHSPTQIQESCEHLCGNPEERQHLLRQQWKYLQCHPILQVPILPGLP